MDKVDESDFTGVAITIFTTFCLLIPFVFIGLAISTESVLSEPVVELPFPEWIAIDGLMSHLARFMAIAEAHNHTRALGTPGYLASVQYVEDTLRAQTNYNVTRQTFPLTIRTVTKTVLRRVQSADAYVVPKDVYPMTYTGAAAVTAPASPVPDEGCYEADYAEFLPGTIALIKRSPHGRCGFADKALHALEAGAVGVLIYNDGSTPDRMGVVSGTLGGVVDEALPVVGLSNAVGLQLLSAPTVVELVVEVRVRDEVTHNVHAVVPAGDPDRLMVVGAHLDSVPAGAGINDNGSGSAAILELALQLHRAGLSGSIKQRIQFSWYGAEEVGLRGSNHYVADLMENDRDAFDKIWLMLNFDMLGSSNGMRGVYNGESADPEILWLSATIQHLFEDHFRANNLTFTLTDFSGRSDYGPFMRNGIPAGGLFSGAEGQKTEELHALFGGLLTSFDPCYHHSCDTLENINRTLYQEMARAAANVTLQLSNAVFGWSTAGRQQRAPLRTQRRVFDGTASNLAAF